MYFIRSIPYLILLGLVCSCTVGPDYVPPTVTIEVERAEGGTILVRWSGDDGPLGTGVMAYDVEVRENSGPWSSWLSGTTETEAFMGLYDGAVNLPITVAEAEIEVGR